MHPAIVKMLRRKTTFAQVRDGIGGCTWCKEICERKAQPALGRLPVLFVGESPSKIGTVENDIFRGTAHKIMKRWKGEVYETNAIACLSYPPHPRHEQNCRPWLHATIRAIQPKAVVAFGRVAERACLTIRQEWEDPTWTLHILPHPCFMLRTYKPHRIEEYVAEIDSIVAPFRV